MKTTISTTIDVEDRDIIKQNNWKYNEVFKLGLFAKKNNPQMIDRIKKLEEKNLLLAQKLNVLAKKCYVLEENLAKNGIKYDEIEAN